MKIFGYEEESLEQIKGAITAKEIKQQPRLWRETLDLIKENQEEINRFISNILDLNGSKIIFTGAGTSAFVGDVVVPYLNKILPLAVESIATTDIVSNPDNYLDASVPTILVSCARSGNSPESVAAVELAEDIIDDLYQIVLTCNPKGSLAENTKEDEKSLLLLMPKDAHDQGFAMTGSFTTMALSALSIFNLNNFEKIERMLELLSQCGDNILIDKVDVLKSIADEEFNRLIFLGSSTLKGVAEESALKVLELTRGEVMTNFDSSLGFRHGPKSVIDDQTLIVSYLSSDKYTRKYEVDLLKEMSVEPGNQKVVAISAYHDEEVEKLVDVFIAMDQDNYLDDIYLSFPYILYAQMLAIFKSIKLNITPDNPAPDGSVNRVVKGVTIYPYNQKDNN